MRQTIYNGSSWAESLESADSTSFPGVISGHSPRRSPFRRQVHSMSSNAPIEKSDTTRNEGCVVSEAEPTANPPSRPVETGTNAGEREAADVSGRCDGKCMSKDCGHGCRHRRHGFTLIELLVVIAIIA